MTRLNERDNVDQLYDALTPVLAKASVGDFSGEIEIDTDNDRRVNELLVGVQVLLDVINEQTEEIEKLRAGSASAADSKVTLLDEVLNRPTE